jgi:hypothetical protein
MSKTATALLIARILEHVPVPFLPQAAQAFDDVLSVIEAEHAISLTDLRSELAAAREPWQRIHDLAEKRPATAAELGFPHGSTGE